MLSEGSGKRRVFPKTYSAALPGSLMKRAKAMDSEGKGSVEVIAGVTGEVTDILCQCPALGLEITSGQLRPKGQMPAAVLHSRRTHPPLVIRPLAFRVHFPVVSVPFFFSSLTPCHPTHVGLLRLASKNTASPDRQLATS